MDNDILFNILKGVIIVAVSLITGFVVPFIKDKINSINDENIKGLVMTAVEFAEQTIKDPYAGNEKKQKVLTFLQNLFYERGIKISADELNALIESAVYTMNNTKKKEVDV